MMAIVKGISDPSAEIWIRAFSCGKPDTTFAGKCSLARVYEMRIRNQRVKVPLGSGAGNGAADCCGVCAEGADGAD
jgi:hypothetical protein